MVTLIATCAALFASGLPHPGALVCARHALLQTLLMLVALLAMEEAR